MTHNGYGWQTEDMAGEMAGMISEVTGPANDDGRGKEFTFRWKHANSLAMDMHDLYVSQKMVDVTISCEGKFIKAHKLVLSTSPYFRSILLGVNELTHHPVISLSDVKYECVKTLVEFLYRGNINIRSGDLQDLYRAAEVLQLNEVVNALTPYYTGKNVTQTTQMTKNGTSTPPCSISQ